MMWIALFNALDNSGIHDDSLSLSGMNQEETIKHKVFEEHFIVSFCTGRGANFKWLPGTALQAFSLSFYLTDPPETGSCYYAHCYHPSWLLFSTF